MKRGLTKTQQAVLDALKALAADGRHPTFVDLTERLGMSNRAHISSHLVSLRMKGRIAFGRKLSSIRIIDNDGPVEPQACPSDLLRDLIDDAAEALADQIGRAGAADVLVFVLANQRAKAKEKKKRENDQVRGWRHAG